MTITPELSKLELTLTSLAILLQDVFPDFFRRVVGLRQPEVLALLSQHERTSYLRFSIHAFQSLEDEMTRTQVLRLVSLPLWHALSPGRLQLELHAQPALAKRWKALLKKDAKAAGSAGSVPAPKRPEATFLPGLLQEFLDTLAALDDQLSDSSTQQPAGPRSNGITAVANGASAATAAGQQLPPASRRMLLHCECFVELLIDLLSQLPTRRFVHALLEDRAVLVKCKLSRLHQHDAGQLFRHLLDLLSFYLSFPIDDHTGDALGEEDVTDTHYQKVRDDGVCRIHALLV